MMHKGDRAKWYSGQNGTDKMVLDEKVLTKWYVQNGTILYFVSF